MLIITRWNFLEPESNEIVTQLSYEKKRVFEVIQGLLKPCDCASEKTPNNKHYRKINNCNKLKFILLFKLKPNSLAGAFHQLIAYISTYLTCCSILRT